MFMRATSEKIYSKNKNDKFHQKLERPLYASVIEVTRF